MDRKICLITGSDSGIGKEAAILMAQQGFKVTFPRTENCRYVPARINKKLILAVA
jgi:NAD(P)-dependent dehydrogenase (short-subunit alcohol dehydrogenase family)